MHYLPRLTINSGCGHCKSLAPIWDDLAEEISSEYAENGINIAKIDMTKNEMTRDRFGVRGYPTLKYLADRKMYDYHGPRSLDNFVEFVTGGYLEAKPVPVPPPPSWLEVQMTNARIMANEIVKNNEILRVTLKDFEHILDYRKNAAVVLVVIGAFIGFAFGLFFGSMGKNTKVKKD